MWFLFLSKGFRLPAFLISVAGILICQWAFSSLSLSTEAAPWGILSLQFAGTEFRAIEIVQSWDLQPYGRERALTQLLYVDFVYPLTYSTVLGLASLWARDVYKVRDDGWAKFARATAWVPWSQTAAMLFDWAENLATLQLLRQPIPLLPWPALITSLATVKWSLITLGAFYIIGSGVRWLIMRSLSRSTPDKQ